MANLMTKHLSISYNAQYVGAGSEDESCPKISDMGLTHGLINVFYVYLFIAKFTPNWESLILPCSAYDALTLSTIESISGNPESSQ